MIPYQNQNYGPYMYSSKNLSNPFPRPENFSHSKQNSKLQQKPTTTQTHYEKIFNTVAVISVTDKPFFPLNRCKKGSASLPFFWVLAKWPESSMSRLVRPEKLLLDRTVIDWIDLAFLWKSKGERIAGIEERAADKAASMRAISSSLTISIGISGTLLLRGDSESDPPLILGVVGDRLSFRGEMTVGIGTLEGRVIVTLFCNLRFQVRTRNTSRNGVASRVFHMYLIYMYFFS